MRNKCLNEFGHLFLLASWQFRSGFKYILQATNSSGSSEFWRCDSKKLVSRNVENRAEHGQDFAPRRGSLPFPIGNILLRHAGFLRQLLLGKSLRLAKGGETLTDF